MGSILLNPTQPSFSDTLLAPLKNHKVHHHASASRNHRFKCNSMSRTSSFNYRSSASVPLHEFPSTRVEFPDLNGDYMPPHFNMNAKGVLYLEKKGMHNWMKNHLDINFNLDFPPLLDWVPHLVLQTILQSVLKTYVDDINNGFAVRLLADYNLFKRKKPKNLV
ncbi:hypothetical protein ACSQ67_008321 [Phaseolus vulgaris]